MQENRSIFMAPLQRLKTIGILIVMVTMLTAIQNVAANDWIHPFGDGASRDQSNRHVDPWLQQAQHEARDQSSHQPRHDEPTPYFTEGPSQASGHGSFAETDLLNHEAVDFEVADLTMEGNDIPLLECIDPACDAYGSIGDCDSCAIAGHSSGLFSPEQDWEWTFLPRGVLYSTYWASAVEPRLSVATISESDHGALIDSSIAGRFPIVRFGSRNRLEGWQLDLIGGVRLRQDPDLDLDMQANDFRYDLPLTYRKGQHAFKFGFYHVSSHTGDEYLVRNGLLNRKNFLRDTFTLGYSYFPIEELRLYAETGWAFNSDVSEPWEFQFGFDYGPRTGTKIYGAPFIAANGHLREELDFGGNFDLQLGWAWRGDSITSGTLRTGLHYYNGGSSQFSFYDVHEQQVGWGLWYDF